MQDYTSLSYYQANEYHTLYTWLEQLPEALLASSPALCLGYARALLYRADTWRLSQATLALLEKLFQMAEERYGAEHDLRSGAQVRELVGAHGVGLLERAG